MLCKTLILSCSSRIFSSRRPLLTLLTRSLSKAPENEPILDYSADPNSPHRLELERCLRDLEGETKQVPIVIKGKTYKSDEVKYQSVPFDHRKKVAQFYHATHELIHKAAEAAVEAKEQWSNVPVERRLNMLEKAANLVAGKYRQQLNAATIMGQAKTAKQAEIDSAAELADFFRFNAHYLRLLLEWQPRSTNHEHNLLELHRGLDGFVAAISPFNFTAIGGNLAAAPALMGNCVVWKPSDTAVLSNYLTFKVLQEAGFPDGVLNFVPSGGLDFGRVITGNNLLAGINFTGSLTTFQWLWSEVGTNIKRYKSFPRLIGECGGKNFHFVHVSAHLDTVVAQTIRSSFEYSGQKCSACSRLYVPASLWPKMKDQLISITRDRLKIGPANDFDTFASAVIDSNAFERITNYINYAKASQSEIQILCGGQSNDEVGYYIQPTICETNNPNHRLMQEEIFGPILTVFVYPDSELDKTMNLINDNNFALTGSIFGRDENFIKYALSKLRMSAGNLYINDKSTGAVVGQQPFGGSKLSGTNDKAGGPHYLMRWSNQQTIKRTKKDLVDI